MRKNHHHNQPPPRGKRQRGGGNDDDPALDAFARRMARANHDSTDAATVSLLPADTEIPDPTDHYHACFAVPRGARVYLCFGGKNPPLFFAAMTRIGHTDVHFRRHAAANAAHRLAGDRDAGDDDDDDAGVTVLSGVWWRPAAADAFPAFRVDAAVVARGTPCLRDARSMLAAPDARTLHRAIADARTHMLPRRCRVLLMDMRLRPPRAPADAQWLPDAWTPEYAVRVFQLRDLAQTRPHLNLLDIHDPAANWRADTYAPAVGSGALVDRRNNADDAPLEDEEEEEEEEDRPPPPEHRTRAVFAVQADVRYADVYRLFCLRPGARPQDFARADARAFHQLALVDTFTCSATMNTWFRCVPQHEKFAWAALDADPDAAEAAARAGNADGQRILLIECNYDRARNRWIPGNQLVPFEQAHRIVLRGELAPPP